MINRIGKRDDWEKYFKLLYEGKWTKKKEDSGNSERKRKGKISEKEKGELGKERP